jgi:DNA-binding SARP family transcriptional activator
MPFATCSLRLFGAPELRCAGAVLLLQPQRSHQLLTYLALRADWVRREHVAALFWPERGEAAARSNLRKVILLAHQALKDAGADPIEDRAGALRWRVATDVAAFQQAAERGACAEAADLYHGPLMRGLDGPGSMPFAEWLQFERSRLAERWRDCVLGAARACADPATRAGLAARLLARDPLDEPALRLQLAALTAAGRPADAHGAYRTYASNLAQDTGLAPSADLRALCPALPRLVVLRVWDQAATFRVDARDPESGRTHSFADATALLAYLRAPGAATDPPPKRVPAST